jgi:hypothetical protein
VGPIALVLSKGLRRREVPEAGASCQWCRPFPQAHDQAMTAIFFLALFIAIAALAPRFGKDSRNLRDHPWESHRS